MLTYSIIPLDLYHHLYREDLKIVFLLINIINNRQKPYGLNQEEQANLLPLLEIRKEEAGTHLENHQNKNISIETIVV